MNHKRLLLKNTVMLYILTFSGYLFSFLTAPYQTRVLGPEVYGRLGFAQACAVYVQLFLDFGFLLSATEDTARHRDDPQSLGKLLSAVTAAKLLLGAAAFGVVAGLCLFVPKFRQDWQLHMLFFGAAFVNALLPDFLYRGMEKMEAITYRTVAVKLFFTVTIFVFLKDREDYYAVPILNGFGALGACIWAYFDVRRRFFIRLWSVGMGEIVQVLRRSASFFLSRIASTVYGATNTVILGLLCPVGVLGYYTSAEKLMTTARSAFSPIADSLYPYMVRNRDFKLPGRLLLVLMPPILLGCIIVGVFAEEFCVMLFGTDFRPAGELLRLLLSVVAMALPVYLLGFPVLSPLGLAKFANLSVIAGAAVHGVQLAVLWMVGMLNVKTVCVATCVTEFTILTFRLIVVLRHRGGKL